MNRRKMLGISLRCIAKGNELSTKMEPLYDYFYRFPHEQLRMRGRCRVRIYERKNDACTVLLTELDSNLGESVTEACGRIATNVAAARGLNLKTTRWIQHERPHDDEPHVFDELHFTWDSNNTASDPQWERLDDKQAEALTGNIVDTLNRRLGDLEFQIGKVMEHEPAEAKRTA
jgi:hypothetical protein